ncbi:MAG: hypothetical protein IKA87_03895 [Lentisphaeria bacterium]|nr:hypothetical protein [Lentisphaeria bacterium]
MKKILTTSLLSAAAVIMLLSGCADPKITRTGRNAIEQLLISTAVDRSVAKLDFRLLAGEKVRIDYSNLTTQVDKNYVQGALESHISASGAIIALKAEEAAYVLRPICAALATEDNQLLVGTPPLPIPIPDVTLSLVIPELPFFKRITRNGICKLAVEVIDAKTNKQARIVGPVISSSVNTNWVVLFLPFTTRDFKMGESGPTEIYWFE